MPFPLSYWKNNYYLSLAHHIMQKIIIAITGEMASGKDAVTKHLVEKYQAHPFYFSDSMRAVIRLLHLEETRENLAKLSRALRQTFGEDVFAKVIEAEVKKDEHRLVVIDGVRRLSDIACLRQDPDFVFVYVEAASEKRYERLAKRKQNIDDSAKTYEEFLHDHTLETEVAIPLLRSEADYVIDNNGTIESFYKQIDDIASHALARVAK